MIIGGVFDVALIVILAVVVGGGLALWLLSRCIKIVQQGSVGVVKRLGEFKGVQQLDKFDDASALILTDASGTLDLRTIPLP